MLPRTQKNKGRSRPYTGFDHEHRPLNSFEQSGSFNKGNAVHPNTNHHQSENSFSKKDNTRQRARPRSDYSFYSDNSSSAGSMHGVRHSMGEYRSAGRGAAMGRGSGSLIHPHQTNNFPQFVTRSNYQDGYNNNFKRRNDNRYPIYDNRPPVYESRPGFFDRPTYYDGPSSANVRNNGKRFERNTNQKIENRNNEVRPKNDTQFEWVQLTIYFCPKCKQNYNYKYQQNNKYSGKIPLILQCNHTMCQECIYQGIKNCKVSCPTCLADSILTQEQTPVCQTDVQTIFLPNFYIFGVMFYYRSSGNSLKNLENMSFVSTAPPKKAIQPLLVNPSERCCFATCNKPATMICRSCEGNYCIVCSTVVHKSAKNLMSHEPVPINTQKFTLKLENCAKHPEMQLEFLCKNCEVTTCCYCLLDDHSDHERIRLYSLEDHEMEQFVILQKDAEKVLKQILSAQKKAARMVNFDTQPVKKEICTNLANLHAKFETIEKKLCDELETFKSSHKSLDNIQASLMSSAEEIKILVSLDKDKIGDKKLNLRGALDKLKNLNNIPRFLLNESGQSEPVRFVANYAAVNNLENDFEIEKSDDSEFKLVTEEELPENYVIDESDTEIDEALTTLLQEPIVDVDVISMVPTKTLASLKSDATSPTVKSKKLKELTKKKLGKDMERIEVQHINSLESFFILFKNQHSKLNQLNKEIQNYVKMGGTQTVEQPQLNELYLASLKNESQKEQNWYRARLVDVKNGENGPTYEMFFIDLGKTQVVDGSRITDIPTFLTLHKPFAVECMLHNPMEINWNKRAHYSLAKIINGKETYIIEKSYNQGIYEVDLMIASSDGGITSVIDILVHAHDSVDRVNDDSSIDLLKKDTFCPFLRVFPNSAEFAKNQKEKVIIANVIDPDNIFVHLVKHNNLFKNMNQQIKKHYKSSKAKPCVPIQGTYVIVEYPDKIRSNYHRAFIKNVDLNSDNVHVLLVDWGLNVIVPSSKVRPLKETFTKLESQAVLIKLAHIVPYNKQVIWSHLATNFIQVYQKSQDELKMIVQDTEPKLEVALFDVSGNVDICLNALMVENNWADSVGPISTKVEWPQYEIVNPEFSEEDGLMSSMLKKVHEEADEDSDAEDLKGVKKRQLEVVKVEAPDLIWVKFLEFKTKERELIKDLQVHYSEKKQLKDEWKVGDHCVTEDDDSYSRGKILEKIKNSNSYKIFLWDKVKEVTSPIDKIYILDKYFAIYSQFVFRSHLANIRPAGDTGKWSISAIEALQEIFAKHKRIYAVKALENNESLSKKSWPLDMWYCLVIQGGPLDPDRLKYVSINNFLVKLGFAYKVPKPEVPKSTICVTAEVHDVKTANTGADLIKSLMGSSDTENATESDSAAKKFDEIETKYKNKEDKDTTLENSAAKKFDEIETKDKNKEDKDPTLENSVVEEDKNVVIKKKKKFSFGTKPCELLVKEKSKEATKLPNDDVEDSKVQDNEEEIINQSEESLQNVEKITENSSNKRFNQKSWNAIIEEDMKNDEESNKSSPYHKSEEAVDDWLPPFRLKRTDFNARVTCVETGGYLYLRDEDIDEIYYKMEENIKEYFDNNSTSVTDHNWQPGYLCTIKFTDGNWYRGKVLKIKSPKIISVLMIDFGSDHDVSPDVLFREVLYLDMGAFATKVKLDKVYARSGTWLTSDYDHFHDLVTDWCRIVVKGPIDVELPMVEVYNERKEFVNQKLVEMCPNLSRCASFPIQDQEDDDTIVIESIENVESADFIANEILMDNVEKQNLTRSETILADYNPDGLKYQMRPLPKELLQGKKMLMEIGGVLSFDRIAFHLPDDDVSEVIYDLVIEIQDVVDSLPNLTEYTIGTPCLARFSEDKIWYRARIIGNNQTYKGYLNVIFVDYGNFENVLAKYIKIIPPNYLQLPQQTWEATLNVALQKDADVIHITEVIYSLEKKKLFIKLIEENPLVVDVYDENNILCYKNLIKSSSLKSIQGTSN